MAQVTLFASSVVLGLFAVAIALLLSRWRSREYVSDGGTEAEAEVSPLERAASSQAVWIVAFLALVGLALGGAVFYVSDASIPIPGGAGVVLSGLLVAIVALYFFWGVYHSSRYKGLHRPAALAVTAWMIGLSVVIFIALHLLGFV